MSVCWKCDYRKNTAYHHLACPVQCLGWGIHDAAHLGKDVLLLTADELRHGVSSVLDPQHHIDAKSSGSRRTVGLSRSKAREILHDGTVRGRPITDRQRRFFGWVAGGRVGQNIGKRVLSSELVAFDESNKVLGNTDYRRVFDTTGLQQTVLMSIERSDIGVSAEIHGNTTQTLRIYGGRGSLNVGDTVIRLEPGAVVIVPPGERHEILQEGLEPLKLSSTYVPPEHPVGLVQRRNPGAAEWARKRTL
jgi:mannose-6-phosphate isomerase-like protein (cupin superfamily)